VLEGEQDFWGDAVNTAARLAELARRRQILTTDTTVERFPDHMRADTQDLDLRTVKGKQDALRIFSVIWEVDLESTAVSLTPVKRRPKASLTLTRAETVIELAPDTATIWLGREVGCQVVVNEKTASRRHARIERRDNQFFLVDDSTNGTFVQISGGTETLLRHSQMLLTDQGQISLGTSGDHALDAIGFTVQLSEPLATR